MSQKVQGRPEQLKRLLALLRIGLEKRQSNELTPMNGGTGRQYEAIVKHRRNEVPDKQFFDDIDTAKRWLFRRWADLCIPVGVIASHCAAAIYDHRQSRKPIFTMGALHLLDE